MEHLDHPAGEYELPERGVYWRRSLNKDGKPVAYCVDAQGRERRSYAVQHPARAEMALAALWDHLDLVDPQRRSSRPSQPTVMTLPNTERRAMIEVLDPYALPLAGHWPRRA